MRDGGCCRSRRSHDGAITYLTDFALYGYAPDWSWANDKIIFTNEILSAKCSPAPDDDTWNIFSIQPDGSDLRRLTDVPKGTRLRHAVWSPDGSHILAADEGAQTGRWIDPTTGQLRDLGGSMLAHPHLQPGG